MREKLKHYFPELNETLQPRFLISQMAYFVSI